MGRPFTVSMRWVHACDERGTLHENGLAMKTLVSYAVTLYWIGFGFNFLMSFIRIPLNLSLKCCYHLSSCRHTHADIQRARNWEKDEKFAATIIY